MVSKRSSNNNARSSPLSSPKAVRSALTKSHGQEWRTSAACLAADPRLFDLVTRDEVDFDSTLRLRALNEAKFAKAWEYCDRCEVRTACRLDSQAHSDNMHTVRGGMNPYDVRPIRADDHVPIPRKTLAIDFEAGWKAYVAGAKSREYKRAAHGPLKGPWPEWAEFVHSKLPSLSRVAWDPPGEPTRLGWQLRYALKSDRHVYLVIENSPNKFVRYSAPLGEVRVLV